MLRFIVLLCLLLGSSPAAATPWSAHIAWHDDVLAMWQIEVAADPHKVAREAHPAMPEASALVWRGGEQAESPIANFDGQLALRRGDRVLRLPALQLTVDPELNVVFLGDAKGRRWLVGEMPHRHPGKRLDWRFMNLKLLPLAAEQLGEPALADIALGMLDVTGPQALGSKGFVNCRETVSWPSPSEPADIALIAIPSVQAFTCRICNGDDCNTACTASSENGSVVLAPDATLLNVGDRDVPWYEKFFPAQPPYGNDQHPYLVWALYRIDPDGALVPLGSSGLKHAFFAQNDSCSCAGDRVLYRGCSDLYSAATNNVAQFLGPREEVAPRSGLWGRCGSVFDPDCDGVQDSSGFPSGALARRLRAHEAELLPARNPGASYFIEAWYVIRDDGNLDNGFAHRQVVPTKNGTAWSFPVQGAVSSGPLIHRWVDPATPTASQRSNRLDTADGRIQLAVRVSADGDGYLYRYVLHNLDYAAASFTGSGANLRLQSQQGVAGLHLPIGAGELSAALQLRDDDQDSGNDWSVLAGTNHLALAAATPAGLGWGRMLAITLRSPYPPAEGAATLQLAGGGRAITTLLPGNANLVLRDGFEAAAGSP